jgi:hypothetical protein
MKRAAILLTIVVLFLLSGSAAAMSSDNYRLDWFTPPTSNGGGVANSTNYAINYTVGQTAIAMSASGNYAGCLGYWCVGGEVEYQNFLPMVVKDAS